MAAVFDEFDEFERCSRAFSPIRNRPFNVSHDDCSSLQDKTRLQAKMRLRASFKSEHAYRSKKKQLDELAQNILNDPAQNMRIGSCLQRKTHTRESVTGVFDSSEEIDCDFPSGEETSDDDLDDGNITLSQNHIPVRCPSPVRIRVGSPSIRVASPSRSPNSPSPQTHHHRSKSCRVRSRKPKDKQFVPRDQVRQRTYSMPSRSRRPKLANRVEEVSDSDDEEEDVYLVRTFSTSAKGIINRGDSFKKKPLSAQSSVEGSKLVNSKQHTSVINVSQANNMGSNASLGHLEDPYAVYIIGTSGVGKTSLIRQFMSSEYMGNPENTAVADAGVSPKVSILLDGTESTLGFTKLPDADDLGTTCSADAFVVVFAVNDRDSFDDAIMCLHELRKRALLDKTATILVANKGDIVRGRDIEEEEAKKMAVRYGCKYIEVSAIINVKVDELLVGILKQIRLKDQRKEGPKKHKKSTCVSDDSGCIPQPRSIVKKIFCKHPREFRSCDNLLVL